MKKNYPLAIVCSICILTVNYLVIGTVSTIIGWLLGITIRFKTVIAAGFILFILQLLAVESGGRKEN